MSGGNTKKYKVADISMELDENGELKAVWCAHAGMHASQGGMEFGFGSFGVSNIEEALELLKVKLERDLSALLKLANKKSESSEKDQR